MNLITVPSCDEHNSNKSEDDEFLRAILLFSAADKNLIASNQFLTKLVRAAARSPGKYQEWFRDVGTAALKSLRALRIDRTRFDNCIDHLARAIFFNHHQHVLTSPLVVLSPNFFSGVEEDQPQPHELSLKGVEAMRGFLQPTPIIGQNPQVFKYRFSYNDQSGFFAFACQIYEFFEIFAGTRDEQPTDT